MHLRISAQPILVPEGGSKHFNKLIPACSNLPLKAITLCSDGPADTSGVKRAGTSLSKATATVQSPIAQQISYSTL